MSLNNVLKKETTLLSNCLLTIKLNYLHDLKIMFQCLLHLNMYIWLNPDFLSDECSNEYDVTLAKTTHVDAQQSQDVRMDNLAYSTVMVKAKVNLR